MQLIRGTKVNQNCFQTKKKSFLHISRTHSLSLPFPPISLKSRMHACPFVCCEGSKHVFNNGKNIFMQAFTGLCKGSIKKTIRRKPQLYSTSFSGQEKKFAFVVSFLVFSVQQCLRCQFLKGHLTQSKTQQVAGPFTESCKNFPASLSYFISIYFLF